jgi:hypothetical protein
MRVPGCLYPALWIAAVASPPLVAAEEPAPPASPAEVHLGPSSLRGGGAERPLDWVLARVPSGADDWEGEKAHDQAAARLQSLAAHLAAMDLTGTALAEFLAPGFRAGDLAPEPAETVHRGAGGLEVKVRVFPPVPVPVPDSSAPRPPSGTTSPDDLASALRAWFAGWSRVAKAKFKVFHLAPIAPGSPRAAARVLLEADGDRDGGGLVQLRATLETVWERAAAPAGSDPAGAAASPWRLADLRAVSIERASVRERPFHDAAPELFAGCRSFREQMLVGVDGWRGRIDSASGIDIYGHQGVSVGDFDGDGWEDLYVAQPAGLPNRLYRNLRGAAFADVTEESGAGILDSTGGSLFFDHDQDGDLDLAVITSVETLLFDNDGRGRFTRRTGTGLEGAVREGASSMGAAAADYDRDGDLDLYIFSYIFWSGAGAKTHTSYPYPYHDANNGAPNFLYRNEGGGKFTDVTAASGLDANNHRFSLAASWCDYDDDGDQDLCVANDFGKKNLYRNEGDGRFTDVAAAAGVEDTGNGMSVTWEDYDADGRIDLYLGNMWSSAGGRLVEQPAFRDAAGEELQPLYRRMARGNSLFRNLGGGRFADVSEAAGVTFGRWAWSCQFLDYDADGREDLAIANGFVTNESDDDL